MVDVIKTQPADLFDKLAEEATKEREFGLESVHEELEKEQEERV